MALDSATVNVGSYGQLIVELISVTSDQPNWRSEMRVRVRLKNKGTSGSYNRDGVYVGIGLRKPNGEWWTDWSDNNVPFSVSAGATDTIADEVVTAQHLSDGSLDIDIRAVLGSTGTSTFGNGGTAAFYNYTLPVLATAPPAPTTWKITGISNTAVSGNADSNGSGGLTVDQWQLRYRKVGTSAYTYKDLDTFGVGTASSLSSKTDYEFWNRRHNAIGWSGWSGRTTAKTHDVPDTPSKIVVSSIEQTRAIFDTKENGSNGSSIINRRIYWNTSNSHTGQTSVDTDGYDWVNDLPPGDRIYAWSRAENGYGWSGYSPVVYFDTVAGAYFEGKRAVPYMKVSGAWKLLWPHIRSFGYWRKSG